MIKDMILYISMPFRKLYLRVKHHVFFEPKSIVYPSAKFEGYNRVCRGTYLARSFMGTGSYVGKQCSIVSTWIGRYSCIGPNVRTTSGTHPTSFVSMHPAFYSTRGQAGFTFVSEQKYNENMDTGYHTRIGNDVWIGDSAILTEGVKIGDGAVIAAGCVVTKDVPPYAVVAGVPAKVLRYRFPEEDIETLLNTKWWQQDMAWLRKNADCFTNIELLKKCIATERVKENG